MPCFDCALQQFLGVNWTLEFQAVWSVKLNEDSVGLTNRGGGSAFTITKLIGLKNGTCECPCNWQCDKQWGKAVGRSRKAREQCSNSIVTSLVTHLIGLEKGAVKRHCSCSQLITNYCDR